MKRDFIRASSKKKKGEKQGTSKSDSSLQLILMQRLLHAHIAPISRLTSFVKYKKKNVSQGVSFLYKPFEGFQILTDRKKQHQLQTKFPITDNFFFLKNYKAIDHLISQCSPLKNRGSS